MLHVLRRVACALDRVLREDRLDGGHVGVRQRLVERDEHVLQPTTLSRSACYICCVLAIDDLPQLRLLLWNRATRVVSEEEALALYEANRQWVDPHTMTERERAVFDRLVEHVGHGVFNG